MKDSLVIGDDASIERSYEQPPSLIELDQGAFAAASSRGIGYKNINEDRIMISKQYSFFAVIDGMGGPGDGAKATEIVIEELIKLTSISINTLQEMENISSNRIKEECETSQSGVSIVICWIEKNVLNLGYLGDVKLVLIGHNQEIKYETKDHSLVNQWLEEGILNEQDAINHPQRNIITKALTGVVAPEMSTAQLVLSSNDRLIIASDGLWDNFTVTETLEMIQGLSPEESVRLLMKKACLKMNDTEYGEGSLLPKPDNISILIGDLTIPHS